MKNSAQVFLLYDDQGNIISGAVVPPELSEQLELLPGAGESVLKTTLKEIGVEESPNIFTEDHVAEESMTTIREAVKGFRIDVGMRKLVQLPKT